MLKESMIPLYQQLADEIKAQIHNGDLKPGEKMMTEAEFSECFKVSRITVRKAIELLADEGHVVKRQGIGTFVAEKKLHRVLKNQVQSFSEMSVLNGSVPSSELVSVDWVIPDTKIMKVLQLKEQEKILHIIRIRKNDDVPVMLEESYYPPRLSFLLTENLTGSTYQIFKDHGFIPTHGKKVFGITYASEEEAEKLDVPVNQALMLQMDDVSDQNGEPLHYSRVLINAERYQMTLLI